MPYQIRLHKLWRCCADIRRRHLACLWILVQALRYSRAVAAAAALVDGQHLQVVCLMAGEGEAEVGQ